MASGPYQLKVPSRARIKLPTSFRRYEFEYRRHEGLSITGPYVQVQEQPRNASSGSKWLRPYQTQSEHFDKRSPRFRNIWMELIFIYSICMPGLLAEYFLLGSIVILPRFLLGPFESDETNIVSNLVHQVWPFIAFPLSITISLLSFQRLSDKFGVQICHIGGLIWLALWSLVAGYAKSYWFLCFCRAASGLGSAATIAPGSSFINHTYSGGSRKKFVRTMFRLSSVFGIFWGLLIAGAVSRSSPQLPGWYFWTGALLALSAIITSLISMPSDRKEKMFQHQHLGFDGLGTIFLIPGLIFFLFVIVQAPSAIYGWATSYIPCLLIIGLALLGIFIHVESCGYATSNALMPTFIFQRQGVNILLLLALIVGGQTGVFYLWSQQLFSEVMKASSFQITAWYMPLCAMGVLIAIIGPKLVPNHPHARRRHTVLIAQLAMLVATLLLVISNNQASYWIFAFPSILVMGAAITVTPITLPILIARCVSKEEQRLAHTLVTFAKYLGMTLMVGIGGNIQSAVLDGSGNKIERSIKAVFWFSFALSCVQVTLALVLTKYGRTIVESDKMESEAGSCFPSSAFTK